MKEFIEKYREFLTPKEYKILSLRYGLDDENLKTFQEIGIEFGVTNSRAKQLHDRAMIKIADLSQITCPHCQKELDITKITPMPLYGKLVSSERNVIPSEMRDIRIEGLSFSTRTLNALNCASIRTIGGLTNKREEDIFEIEGIGMKGITEIKRVLEGLGLKLK